MDTPNSLRTYTPQIDTDREFVSHGRMASQALNLNRGAENKRLMVSASHLADNPHPPRSCSTTSTKLMSTSSQGGFSSSGQTRLNPNLTQPVSGDRLVLWSVLTKLQQISKEESMVNQIKKLTVSLLTDVLGFGTDETPGNKSTRLTRY